MPESRNMIDVEGFERKLLAQRTLTTLRLSVSHCRLVAWRHVAQGRVRRLISTSSQLTTAAIGQTTFDEWCLRALTSQMVVVAKSSMLPHFHIPNPSRTSIFETDVFVTCLPSIHFRPCLERTVQRLSVAGTMSLLQHDSLDTLVW